MKEITRRNVLLECLSEREREMRSLSYKGYGIDALRGYEEVFEESQKKCAILRELIQALESEPVRRSVANWQMEIMKGKEVTLEDLEPAEEPETYEDDSEDGEDTDEGIGPEKDKLPF